MSFRNILVYLGGGQRAEIVMKAAVDIAVRHQARLSGLHVVGFLLPTDTGIYPCGDNHPFGSSRTFAMIRETALETACRAEAVFRGQLQHAGLAGDWSTAEGMVAYTAAQRARYFDMTIVGQIDPERPPLGTRKFVPEALFLESGRPVLIVPCRGQIDNIGTKVVIGWDGSREAARAVNDAMPFLVKAESVTVVTLGHDGDASDAASTDPAGVVFHLAQHGIPATGFRRSLGKESVADALLGCAADADLLVVGGYAHSRLREWVAGGVTRDLLRQMTVPVLMAH